MPRFSFKRRAQDSGLATSPERVGPMVGLAWLRVVPIYLTLLLPAGGIVLTYRLADGSNGSLVLPMFWISFAVMAIVVSFIIRRRTMNGTEGLLFVACVGALLYLPKFLRGSHFFLLPDELAHWRAADELVRTGHLESVNPLNPMADLYPGLAGITAGLSRATGISVFAAGNFVILLAHSLSLIALYYISYQISRSTKVAACAAIIYAANPAYLFFDAQFAYESLALPLSLVCLAIVLSRSARVSAVPSGHRRKAKEMLWFALSVAVGVTVVVTHHVSSYFTVGMLLMLAVAAFLVRRQKAGFLLLAVGVGVGAAVVLWIALVAPATIDYLKPDIVSNLNTIPGLFGGASKLRTAFSGSTTPKFEVIGSYVGLVVLASFFVSGAWRLLHLARSEKDFRQPVFLILGVFYFLSLPLLALQNAQNADVIKRSWEFSFVGLALVSAWPLMRVVTTRRKLLAMLAPIAIFAAFVNGISSRSGLDIRLPGVFEASDTARAFTPELVDAAQRFRVRFGDGHRFMADAAMSTLFGSYGGQQPVTYQANGARPWLVFDSPRVTSAALRELEVEHVRFVMVDLRDARHVPVTGYYFNHREPNQFRHGKSLSLASLRKFGLSTHFRSVMSKGPLRVYRVVARSRTSPGF